MTPAIRALALLFLLSGILGVACGTGSCCFTLGYGTGVIPAALEKQGLDPEVSGSPRQVAAVYLSATLVLMLMGAAQLIAAYGLFAGKPWGRRTALTAAVGALVTFLPAGVVALVLAWKVRERAS